MHRERVIFSRLYVQYTCIRHATLKHLNVVLLYRVKNKIQTDIFFGEHFEFLVTVKTISVQ